MSVSATRPTSSLLARIVVLAFIIACGLFFLLPGLLGVLAAILRVQDEGWSQGGVVFLFLCVAGCIVGSAIIFKGARSWSRESRRNAAIRDHPREPWLWQPDAGGHEIRRGTSSELYKMLVALGAVLSGILVPIWVSSAGESGLSILSAVSAGSVAMLVAGLVLWRRQAKFGGMVLVLDTVPVFLGSRFRCQVSLPAGIQLRHAPQVGLECVHDWLTGSGKHAVRSEKVLWRESQVVPIEKLSLDAMGRVAVPIEMNLPAELPPTDDTDWRNFVRWSLRLEAALPGFDANEIFRVPIYDRSGLPRTPSHPGKAF